MCNFIHHLLSISTLFLRPTCYPTPGPGTETGTWFSKYWPYKFLVSALPAPAAVCMMSTTLSLEHPYADSLEVLAWDRVGSCGPSKEQLLTDMSTQQGPHVLSHGPLDSLLVWAGTCYPWLWVWVLTLLTSSVSWASNLTSLSCSKSQSASLLKMKAIEPASWGCCEDSVRSAGLALSTEPHIREALTELFCHYCHYYVVVTDKISSLAYLPY